MFIETRVEWAEDGQHHPIILNTQRIVSYDPATGEVVAGVSEGDVTFWVVCEDWRADFEKALLDPRA